MHVDLLKTKQSSKKSQESEWKRFSSRNFRGWSSFRDFKHKSKLNFTPSHHLLWYLSTLTLPRRSDDVTFVVSNPPRVPVTNRIMTFCVGNPTKEPFICHWQSLAPWVGGLDLNILNSSATSAILECLSSILNKRLCRLLSHEIWSPFKGILRPGPWASTKERKHNCMCSILTLLCCR